jgi:hypothetical protein
VGRHFSGITFIRYTRYQYIYMYICFNDWCYWFDNGLLSGNPRDWHYLNNVIIIKTKLFLLQAYTTISEFGFPFWLPLFSFQKSIVCSKLNIYVPIIITDFFIREKLPIFLEYLLYSGRHCNDIHYASICLLFVYYLFILFSLI